MDTTLALKTIELMDKMLPADKIKLKRDDLYPIAEKLGAELNWGATRWAFVFQKHSVVIKFPRYEETTTDYCAAEVNNYKTAQDYRIERCLLPIEYVNKTASGIPIYIQPMYSFSQDGIPAMIASKWNRRLHGLKDAAVVGKVRCGCVYSPHRLWVERAIQIYGKAFMKSFQKWTKECCVNDLHSSNVGYLGKQPIIIDYAGYHD